MTLTWLAKILDSPCLVFKNLFIYHCINECYGGNESSQRSFSVISYSERRWASPCNATCLEMPWIWWITPILKNLTRHGHIRPLWKIWAWPDEAEAIKVSTRRDAAKDSLVTEKGVSVVGNGHDDASSNPGRDWLHFT